MTDTKETGIRPYGLGKFSTILDSYVYQFSLDSTDDECGDADTTGWYGLLDGTLEYDPGIEELNADEQAELLLSAVMLLHGRANRRSQ